MAISYQRRLVTFSFKWLSGISDISAAQWQHLLKDDYPFSQYAFLSALEQCHCINGQSGWHSQFVGIYLNDALVGALPLYRKNHSYGEYVFDFSWAEAYQRHGLEYYPKWVVAIPFTPVTGTRLLLSPEVNESDVLPALTSFLQHQAEAQDISSLHWLFVPQENSEQLLKQHHLQRHSVQFQWFNHNYQSFDDFLATFASRKRKNVRKERNKVEGAGITVERLSGKDIKHQHMLHFYQCYRSTYLKRSGHQGYLTKVFFMQLLDNMSEQLMLVQASQDGAPIASALYFYSGTGLYGRYWGSLEDIDALHFECCYYQGIEFAIEKQLPIFNPGTQGEHKIFRGFEPTYCYSNHWLAEPEFHQAVERFLQQEKAHLSQYKREAESLLPFKVDEHPL